LNGRLRDPHVGRDLVLGAVLGVLVCILMRLSRVVPSWFGLASGLDMIPMIYPLGTASLIGAILDFHIYLISFNLISLLMLVFLRMATRSVRLAACCLAVLNTIYFCMIDQGSTSMTWPFMALAVVLGLWVLIRLGLLAAFIGHFVLLALNLPITTDSSAFHFGNSLLVMGLVFALALYGAFTSLGGRPLFRDA
jgi:hypothetical protein